MTFKYSIIGLCVIFAVGVAAGSSKKASSKEEKSQDNDKGNFGELKNYEESSRKIRQLPYYYDEYARQDSYTQSQQYYDNGGQNANEYGSPGQSDNGYGQNTYKKPGNKPISIGNGRGNTNVVAIQGSDPASVVGYTIPEGGNDYDQYNNRGNANYPHNSKGNSYIAVKQRPGKADTVILSSRSKNGQQSTVIVNEDGVNLNPVPSYDDRDSYYNQQNYNKRGYNSHQRQGYGGYYN